MSFAPDNGNTAFALAADFINHTSRHLFLTGKAGTGKTTFLKYIKEKTTKKAVVAAPTGVAAINAGGVTLHSLFQLPFGPYLPIPQQGFTTTIATDPNSLMKQVRLNGSKRQVLQELELLIIDEVSMLRCDMLDAIDKILRSVRRNYQEAFGGVQVLFIGDLYQLPPVVQGEEWELLQTCYSGPFFFQSKVIQEAPPLYIELKKIYRQNEQHFIDILNRVRNNLVNDNDLITLNARHISHLAETHPENTITLTTHNRKADALNSAGLEKLEGPLYTFNGVIAKEFNENALPTELTLRLKIGAQVMFIKNDTGDERRYYNGKLAVVTKITPEEILVLPDGDTVPLKLEKETWKNIRYNYNKEKEGLEEEELGSFTQYPIRLAWAVTIHKSQGLTFEKAVIDAGQAFAPGQVYVALSRCTSLNGIILLSKIHLNAIATDPQVIAFSANESDLDTLPNLLEVEKKRFDRIRVINLFDWQPLVVGFEEFSKEIASIRLLQTKTVVDLEVDKLFEKVLEQKQVADKFILQLKSLITEEGDVLDKELLPKRLSNGINWFLKTLYEDIIKPLHQEARHLEKKARVKLAVKLIIEMEDACWEKLNQLQNADFPDYGHNALGILYSKTAFEAVTIKKSGKVLKGSSQKETLELFKAGNSVAAIAEARGLTQGTIHGHLAQFVLTGAIEAKELLPESRISEIAEVIKEIGIAASSTLFKERLGVGYSFDEIRIVLNELKFFQREKALTNS